MRQVARLDEEDPDGRVVHQSDAAALLADEDLVNPLLGVAGAPTPGWALPLAVVIGMAVGAVIGRAVGFFLIRPLYRRHIEQVSVTVGLGPAAVALGVAGSRWER